MRKYVLTLLLLVMPAPGPAAEYQSTFGFPFELSKDWLVLTSKEAAGKFGTETLKSLGLEYGDQENMKAVLERVKTGKVEFYFDRKYSTKDFNKNISVQLMEGGQQPTAKAAQDACASLPDEAARLFGGPVKMKSCGIAELQGITYVAYEYEVPTLATSVIQTEIPFTAGMSIIVVGGSNKAGLEHVRKAHEQITRSIIKYTSAAQARRAKAAGRVPGKDELAALVKNNLLRFSRSVNASDFTEFHGHVSLLWKNEATVEYFNSAFKAFMDNNVNLVPVVEKLTPVFDEKPSLSKEGVLSLKGHYPTRPSRVLFELSFIDEGAGWKLVSTNVNIKPVQ
ncbi:MAG TPA: hypothetical protein DCS42_03255 [Nitrospiraceae bacterium]|nr:hypothetical protein [Nitrospiraceae bacterium]